MKGVCLYWGVRKGAGQGDKPRLNDSTLKILMTTYQLSNDCDYYY